MKRVMHLIIVASCLVCIWVLTGCGGGQQPIPQLTITTAALPNGTSQLAYSQTIQASGGVAPFTWSLTGALPHNLALGSSVTNAVTISGTPDTPVQGLAFTIQVTDSANKTASQAYTVSILLEPDTITLTPSSLSFGPQVTGTVTAGQLVTVANTGSSAVVISGIALSGANTADFSQSNTCGPSLAAAGNCAINVTFTPSQLGPSSASVTITDNTVGSPHSVALDGVGIAPGPNATLSATSLTFFSQTVGTTSLPQSITLSNYGTATLNIASIATSGTFAETDSCSSTLASGANCTIDVTFTPNTAGTLNGTLTVTDNAASSPQVVSLSGTGIGTCIKVGQLCNAQHPCCPGLQCVQAGQLRGVCQ